MSSQNWRQAQLLFHAARQLACRPVSERCEVGGFQEPIDALLSFYTGKSEETSKEINIFMDR